MVAVYPFLSFALIFSLPAGICLDGGPYSAADEAPFYSTTIIPDYSCSTLLVDAAMVLYEPYDTYNRHWGRLVAQLHSRTQRVHKLAIQRTGEVAGG